MKDAEKAGDPDVRYSIRDKEYLEAVKAGDTETAQKIVDDAAEKWGAGEKTKSH